MKYLAFEVSRVNEPTFDLKPIEVEAATLDEAKELVERRRGLYGSIVKLYDESRNWLLSVGQAGKWYDIDYEKEGIELPDYLK